MGLLGWEIGPDFPVGLERPELHDTPHTCCCSGVPGDSEASTKETHGQDEVQKAGALAVLWQVSLSMQLSPRRSQTERVLVVDLKKLLASYIQIHGIPAPSVESFVDGAFLFHADNTYDPCLSTCHVDPSSAFG